MSEFVRPPVIHTLRITDPIRNEVTELMIGAEYDHIVHYPRFGAFILKVIDDEHGFIQCAIDEDVANSITEMLDRPPQVSEWMTTNH